MTALSFRLAAGATITVVGAAFAVAGIVIGSGSSNSSVSTLLAASAWFVVGSFIVVLRPGNSVGWLFSAVGLLWTSGLALAGYPEGADSGALLTVASWYSEVFWLAGLFMMIATLYVFPTGRVSSSAWRPVLAIFTTCGVAAVVYAALEPTVQASGTDPIVRNPIGVAGFRDIEETPVVGNLLFLLLLGGALAGISSLVVRYRGSRGVERQQLKWVALAGPFALLGWTVAGILEGGDLLFIPPFIAIPVAAGIAILRYQLFDVDRLINRTLVYGALTVLLGGAYVGLVLIGQSLSSSLVGSGNLAIAVSTLLVAALFLPLRTRVQHFVDRRFYRSRYDAQRTLEGFGARLREQVELQSLAGDLCGAVDETMKPAHVSLWLRAKELR